jgi:hypothetical protein
MAARFVNRLGTGVFAVPVLLCVLQVSAQGQIPITSCGTIIDKPGDYILANDLEDCSRGGIQIDADATLNLNGHKISGTGEQYGIDVDGNHAVAITGPGTVFFFMDGVVVRIGGKAIVRITNVETLANQGYGFMVMEGAKTVLHKNTALANTAAGFYINSPGNELRDNSSINQINTWGIELAYPYGNSNQIVHNNVTGNRDGIVAIGKDNVIVSNSSLKNREYDMYGGGEGERCTSRWFDNTFETANLPCIH